MQRSRMNEQLWLQGLYVYEAICDVSPALRAMGAKEPVKYSEEPYPITDKEIEERRKKQAKAKFEQMKTKAEAFAARFNKAIKEEADSNGCNS